MEGDCISKNTKIKSEHRENTLRRLGGKTLFVVGEPVIVGMVKGYLQDIGKN